MKSRKLAVLSCIGLLAACGQQAAPAGNTEINLTIGNNAGPTSSELSFEVDRVDYRVTCTGKLPGTYPIPPAAGGGDYIYDDSVDASGQLEIMEAGNPKVWHTVTNLPPGGCTATLSISQDGEVICSGSEDFTVVEDGSTSVNIEMLCSVSIGLPDGSGNGDADFQYQVGNECPKLFNFSAHPRVLPSDQLTTTIQTIAEDLDGSCGERCDPQTCTGDNPPVCTPGPDPGLSTTVSSTSGLGSFDDANASLATFTCDPLFPGPYEICVDLTDGDIDCDKRKCVTVVCPDLCAGVVCDDGSECTADRCDRSTGLCVNEISPDGIACDSCTSTCQAGVCDASSPYITDYTGSYMQFDGVRTDLDITLVNPYSGAEVSLMGNYNLNQASYKGIGTSNDSIVGTQFADALFVHDPLGVQRVCGIESIFAQNGFDILLLADHYIELVDSTISGGNAADVLWTNSGDDTINGHNGPDNIDGGPGNDLINGGAGNDLISIWPGSGFDSIDGWGGNGDVLRVTALASQVTVTASANPGYDFDVFYLGTPMAEIRLVESIELLNDTIDLTMCLGGVCDLCGNGVINGGEDCDDGNNLDGDGCSATCSHE